MESLSAVTNYMHPLSEAFAFVTQTKVHPVWFPFGIAPTAHAARISIAYQSNMRRSSGYLSWGTYLTGYLIMCWGGTILSNLLLGLPPPMFYSFGPLINYLSVHIILTVFFSLVPQVLNPPILNSVLWPLDAILRTNSVTSTLSLLDRPTVHKEYVNSPLTHLILGAIASAGGGTSASTLSTWTSNWSFSTPPFLRAGAGWDGTLDIWGGALVAAIYSTTTGHPAFASTRGTIDLCLAVASTSSQRDAGVSFVLPPLRAKTLATAILSLLFAARVVKTHWRTSLPSVKALGSLTRSAAKEKSKQKQL